MQNSSQLQPLFSEVSLNEQVVLSGGIDESLLPLLTGSSSSGLEYLGSLIRPDVYGLPLNPDTLTLLIRKLTEAS